MRTTSEAIIQSIKVSVMKYTASLPSKAMVLILAY